MTDAIYRRLQTVLDTLPNGFPPTPDGLEIRLLKKIFTPEEAELFCDLRLTPETAKQISERSGRPLEGLEEQLVSMSKRGEIVGIEVGSIKLFAMMPWAVGIYEFQIDRMDREFCELSEQYEMYFGPQLLANGPPLMQTVPIGETVTARQQALPFAEVSKIIENGSAFRVNQCICKKERGMLDSPCKKPTEVCLTVAPLVDTGLGQAGMIFDWGRAITKEQAYQLLHEAEAAGLVHLTSNVVNGHSFICNCCGCCCGVLRPIKEIGITGVVNSHFYAAIKQDDCNNCGVCLDERCQVNAIEATDVTYQVHKERCIGCGLCVTTCPTEAITLVHRPQEEIALTPATQAAWNDERARQRGTDYSAYK